MAARETKRQHTEEKAVHEITAAERAAIERPSIRCKVSRNGSDPQIELDHPDEQTGQALMMDALASADGYFVSGIVGQLANANRPGATQERAGEGHAGEGCDAPAGA